MAKRSSLRAEGGLDSAAKLGKVRLRVGRGRARTPNWSGPCGITFVSCNHMHVELTHDVAQGADVELVWAGDGAQYVHCLRGF